MISSTNEGKGSICEKKIEITMTPSPSNKRQKTKQEGQEHPMNAHRWIALIRGLNVGKSGRGLPMAELRTLLTDTLDYANVRTYIASGNVVFETTTMSRATHLAGNIADAIQEHCRLQSDDAFRPSVIVLSQAELQAAVSGNPFALQASEHPSQVHFFFLSEHPASANLVAIKEASAGTTEESLLLGKVFYVSAPDGIGKSKLVAKAEKLLGVAATSRNYRTVSKLLTMVDY